MAESLYNVAIIKHTSDKPLETLVQEALAALDKTGDPYMEYKLSEALLFGQSSSILENLPLSDSERVQQKLLNVNIETLLQLATAAHERSEVDADQEQEPETAGTVTQKPAPKKAKKQPVTLLVSVAAVAAMGVAIYFLFNEFNKTVPPDTIATANVATKSEKSEPPASVESAQVKPQQVAYKSTPEKTTPASSPGAKGKATQQNQAEAGEASVIPTLSVLELTKLKAILKAVKQQGFGYTESGQYATHIEKLNRLLEMDKPDLALVFAETVTDAYAAALLVLKVARAEQQKQRVDYNDDILLTMKAIADNNEVKGQKPLLTAALSQTHAMLGDRDSATILLQQALREITTSAESTEQQIDCLSKLITNHQHFAQTTATRQLTTKLETMAKTAAREKKPDQAIIGNIYTQLAAISLQNNDLGAATNWLKRIPVLQARDDLLSYLDKIKAE